VTGVQHASNNSTFIANPDPTPGEHDTLDVLTFVDVLLE
jgi:hypothetical protein